MEISPGKFLVLVFTLMYSAFAVTLLFLGQAPALAVISGTLCLLGIVVFGRDILEDILDALSSFIHRKEKVRIWPSRKKSAYKAKVCKLRKLDPGEIIRQGDRPEGPKAKVISE